MVSQTLIRASFQKVRMTKNPGPAAQSKKRPWKATSYRERTGHGGLLRNLSLVHLLQDVEAAGEHLASHSDGGDVVAATLGDVGVGVRERRSRLGDLGGLAEH